MISKTIISNNIKIINPSEELLEVVKEELTYDNPEFITKVRMKLPLWGTPKKISLYKLKDNKLILPYGCLDKFREYLPSNPVIKLNDNGDKEYSSSIDLRDYQEDALASIHHSQSPSGIFVMPAGSGKTLTALELAARLEKTCLWITHTQDLLNQSYSRAKEYFDLEDKAFGKIIAGEVNLGTHITFATVQTLRKSDLDSYKDKFDVVIVDECHNVATSAKQIGMFREVIEKIPASRKFGLTATPHRADGLFECVKDILGDIYIQLDKEVVGDYIVPVKVITVDTQYSIFNNLEILNADGVPHHAKILNDIAVDHERNHLILQKLIDNQDEFNLVLSNRLDHLDELVNLLTKHVDESKIRVVKGSTNKTEREESLELIREGKINYLFASFSLAQEGLDIPRLNRLYLTQPVKDKKVVIQSLGRIERAFEDKECGVCYDFVDRDVVMLRRQFNSRNKVYKSQNYKVVSDENIRQVTI